MWCTYGDRSRVAPQILYDAVKADAWAIGAMLLSMAVGKSNLVLGPQADPRKLSPTADKSMQYLRRAHACFTLWQVNSVHGMPSCLQHSRSCMSCFAWCSKSQSTAIIGDAAIFLHAAIYTKLDQQIFILELQFIFCIANNESLSHMLLPVTGEQSMAG